MKRTWFTFYSRGLNIVLLLVLLFFGDGKQTPVDVVAAIYFLIISGSHFGDQLKLKLHPFLAALWGGLGIYLSVSVFVSMSPGYAVSSLIRYALAFMVFMQYAAPTNRPTLSRFVHEILIFGFCAMAISYIAISIPVFRIFLPGMNLLFPTYGHNQIANIVIFIVPLVLWYAMRQGKRLRVIIVMLLILSTLATLSRGAIALTVVYLAGYLAFYKRGNAPRKSILIITLISIAGVVIGLFALYSILGGSTGQVPPQLSDKSSLVDARAAYWDEAVRAIQTRPVFGTGIGTFYLLSKRLQLSPNSHSWYAHSFPLEVMAEVGVLGFVFIAGLVAGVLVIFYIRSGNGAATNPVFHSVVMTLLYSAAEINLNYIVVWLLLWTSLSYLYWSVSEPRNGIHARWVFMVSFLFLSMYVMTFTVSYISQTVVKNYSISFFTAPYRAENALNYLGRPRVTQTELSVSLPLVMWFHGNNSEILILLARVYLLINHNQANQFYQRAVVNDPQNAEYILEYSRHVLATSDKIALLWVARHLINTITPRAGYLAATVQSNWPTVQECFNEKTLLWSGAASAYQYHAKTLYRVGLCLVDSGKYDSGREFLRASMDSDTGWSNIYLDYAGLSGWTFRDENEAQRAIYLCKSNPNSKKHCLYEMHFGLPKNSMSEPQIKFNR